ncbi:MAG: hypothetical protein HYZ28_21355 [Myxococcales bacterium]|nr:hypothetical protein [Myxococcales bacterium]
MPLTDLLLADPLPAVPKRRPDTRAASPVPLARSTRRRADRFDDFACTVALLISDRKFVDGQHFEVSGGKVVLHLRAAYAAYRAFTRERYPSTTPISYWAVRAPLAKNRARAGSVVVLGSSATIGGRRVRGLTLDLRRAIKGGSCLAWIARAVLEVREGIGPRQRESAEVKP